MQGPALRQKKGKRAPESLIFLIYPTSADRASAFGICKKCVLKNEFNRAGGVVGGPGFFGKRRFFFLHVGQAKCINYTGAACPSCPGRPVRAALDRTDRQPPVNPKSAKMSNNANNHLIAPQLTCLPKAMHRSNKPPSASSTSACPGLPHTLNNWFAINASSQTP